MSPAKSRPAELAAEAKRLYLPHIAKHYPQFPARSTCYTDTASLVQAPHVHLSTSRPRPKLRVAVIEGDPVDVALDWHDVNCRESQHDYDVSSLAGAIIAVINPANERRAGGDWESGLLAPEECLCRRSTLAQALQNPSISSKESHFPIRNLGGIYAPHVVIFRASANCGSTVWKDFKCLPIISVAPIRRPKLDESGLLYSFSQERDLMHEKIRSICRIAIVNNHRNFCTGTFGTGTGFRNPAPQIARMWREVLFDEEEFQGRFDDVVFAIEDPGGGNATNDTLDDIKIFQKEFAPANIIKTRYRESI